MGYDSFGFLALKDIEPNSEEEKEIVKFLHSKDDYNIFHEFGSWSKFNSSSTDNPDYGGVYKLLWYLMDNFPRATFIYFRLGEDHEDQSYTIATDESLEEKGLKFKSKLEFPEDQEDDDIMEEYLNNIELERIAFIEKVIKKKGYNDITELLESDNIGRHYGSGRYVNYFKDQQKPYIKFCLKNEKFVYPDDRIFLSKDVPDELMEQIPIERTKFDIFRITDQNQVYLINCVYHSGVIRSTDLWDTVDYRSKKLDNARCYIYYNSKLSNNVVCDDDGLKFIYLPLDD
jgi:hypothetical protein